MLIIKYIKRVAIVLSIFMLNNVQAQQILEVNTQIDDSLIGAKLQELRSSVDEYDNTRYDFGEMTYAPDKRFKILTIHAEACGAYCHTFFENYIYHKNGEKVVESDIEMADLSMVTDIIKIKNTDRTIEYVIFGKRHVRPRSVETGTEVAFSHLIFAKGIPKFKEIYIYNSEGKLFKDLDVRFYSSENMCVSGDEVETPKGVPPTLSYQAKTMTITYEYAQTNENFDYPCKYITGTYRYENGIFTNN